MSFICMIFFQVKTKNNYKKWFFHSTNFFPKNTLTIIFKKLKMFFIFSPDSYRLNLEMDENTCLRKNTKRGKECDVIT